MFCFKSGLAWKLLTRGGLVQLAGKMRNPDAETWLRSYDYPGYVPRRQYEVPGSRARLCAGNNEHKLQADCEASSPLVLVLLGQSRGWRR